MLKLIEEERRGDPKLPATLTVLGQFMKAQGEMMVNEGIPSGLLGAQLDRAFILARTKEGR
jgi:hypothetical protein